MELTCPLVAVFQVLKAKGKVGALESAKSDHFACCCALTFAHQLCPLDCGRLRAFAMSH